MAQSVSRLVTGWKTEGSEFESRYDQEFFLLHVVLTRSGANPTSKKVPGVKRQGRETDPSPPASAAVKKMSPYTSTPPYAFTM
jgi:hypothetical protein